MTLTNQYYKIVLGFLLVGLIGLTSCEDVVEIDVEGSSEGLSIDAWVNDLDTLQSIRVSRAINYFNNQITPGVTDAEVSLRRSDGVVFVFDHAGDGVYTWLPDSSGHIGQVGDSFDLLVSVTGVDYNASSTINRVPVNDRVEFEFRDDELGGDDGLYAEFFARDFPGLGDAYWIKTFRNGIFQGTAQQLNIAYDAGFDSGSGVDGLIFITPIREFLNRAPDGQGSEPYADGETIRVEIHSINRDAFAFMEIARDQITNGDNGIFALPLANTPTNITASDNSPILGFFNMSAVSVGENVAKE